MFFCIKKTSYANLVCCMMQLGLYVIESHSSDYNQHIRFLRSFMIQRIFLDRAVANDFHCRLICRFFSWFIVYKMSQYPKLQSGRLQIACFYQQQPKIPKSLHLYYDDKEKQHILTFKKLEPANVWHLCLKLIIKIAPNSYYLFFYLSKSRINRNKLWILMIKSRMGILWTKI